MNTLFRMSAHHIGLLAVLVCAIGSGCHGSGGDGNGTPAPAAQGAVKNALVYADHSSGPEANYVVDADEADTATMLNDDGTFTLATTPAYDYVVVSQFGEYTLSDRPAMHMLSPAGARNISPLTTMVALNPSARSTIESLGVAYDTDLSTTTTPAVILLSQSIEAIVAAITNGLNQGGNTLTASDINVIQRALMAEIADKIENQTAAQLADPAALTAVLEASVIDALVSIGSNTSIAAIAIDASAASAIVDPIVKAVAQAISASAKATAFSASAVAQKAFITPDAVAIISAAIDNAANVVAALAVVIAKPKNPPPIISGDPPTTAIVGVKYSFKPTVTDTDNNADFYLFIIKNKPRWAKFNILTGELSGTPKTSDIGTTTGIVITVIDVLDFLQHSSLPAFKITVMAPTGSTGSTGGGGF